MTPVPETMSHVFPKWANRLPLHVLGGLALVVPALAGGIWYYFTPKYTRVGYQPRQPVAFSHAVHVDQVGMDCRYCHTAVEQSWYAALPSSASCLNCHHQVLREDARLELVRHSAATGEPIAWVQIHRAPDYVAFHHAVHVRRGFSCLECHGAIHRADEAFHAQPLSMSFCLECHRDPAAKVRPLDKVTDLNWVWDTDPRIAGELQKTKGARMVHDAKVQFMESCSACHR